MHESTKKNLNEDRPTNNCKTAVQLTATVQIILLYYNYVNPSNTIRFFCKFFWPRSALIFTVYMVHC